MSITKDETSDFLISLSKVFRLLQLSQYKEMPRTVRLPTDDNILRVLHTDNMYVLQKRRNGFRIGKKVRNTVFRPIFNFNDGIFINDGKSWLLIAPCIFWAECKIHFATVFYDPSYLGKYFFNTGSVRMRNHMVRKETIERIILIRQSAHIAALSGNR